MRLDEIYYETALGATIRLSEPNQTLDFCTMARSIVQAEIVDAKICLDILSGKQYMATRRSDSAFPIGYNRDTDSLIEGMTKREYFAIMIMQGHTAANTKFEDEYQKARLSVAEADALIDILAYEVNPLNPE